MRDTVIFQEAADLDGALGGIAGIPVHQLGDAIAERLRHRGNDSFRAARPFVLIAAALGTHTPLEGIEALIVAKLEEAFGLIARCDVALHGGGIGAELARRAADQRGDGLAFELAAQVPQGGVEPGGGAAEIGARIFVFALVDEGQRIGVVERICAQRMARHLAVEDLAGDVGIVGRDLAPALVTGIGGDADEADEFVAEGFKLADLQGALPSCQSGRSGPGCRHSRAGRAG